MLITQFSLAPDESQLYPIKINMIKGSGLADEGIIMEDHERRRTLRKSECEDNEEKGF